MGNETGDTQINEIVASKVNETLTVQSHGEASPSSKGTHKLSLADEMKVK